MIIIVARDQVDPFSIDQDLGPLARDEVDVDHAVLGEGLLDETAEELLGQFGEFLLLGSLQGD